MKSHLPVLNWLPHYKRSWLKGDIVAGLTIVALLVPEGMAYAELAGMPPQVAFYAAPIGLLLYALLGSSRHLVVAVSSAIAVMSASIISGLAPAGTAEFIALTSGLAMLAGIVAILAGLLRLGRIAQFFSESVLVGFVSGLALLIIIKQLPKLVGVEAGHGNSWQRLYDLIIHLPEAHLLTAVVGLTSLGLMFLIERRFHRIPAALVALIYGIVIVTVFNLETLGVHIIGEIPAGLAPPQLPDLELAAVAQLIPGAIGIALVMFAEGIGPARGFAGKHGYDIDANQELIGMGAANFGAGLFQGFSIGASLSKSAANESAGAKTQLSGIIAAGLTALVALFLTSLFYNLPEATLGAIVIVAVSGMVNIGVIRRLYQVRRIDFALALLAIIGVLTFEEVLYGLLIAVIISLIALILRASQSRISVLARKPGQLTFEDQARESDLIPIPGLLILRPEEELFFANADTLRDEIRNLVLAREEPVKSVLLDLEMTYDLDVPSAAMLTNLKRDLHAQGIGLMLSRIHPDVQDMLHRSGAAEVIGTDHIYERALQGVATYLQTMEGEDETLLAMAYDGLQRILDFAEAAHPAASVAQREELGILIEQIKGFLAQKRDAS